MLKTFFLLLISFCCISAKAQTTFFYKNPLFFKGESVVFTADYKPNFLLKDIKGRFTPTQQELDSAELIFKERYNLDLQEPKEFYVAPVENVTKEYKFFKRQYMGWIDNKGDKIIFIQMLNFKRKKLAKQKFEGWEKEFEVGLGGWYEENRFLYKINLTRKILINN